MDSIVDSRFYTVIVRINEVIIENVLFNILWYSSFFYLYFSNVIKRVLFIYWVIVRVMWVKEIVLI